MPSPLSSCAVVAVLVYRYIKLPTAGVAVTSNIWIAHGLQGKQLIAQLSATPPCTQNPRIIVGQTLCNDV